MPKNLLNAMRAYARAFWPSKLHVHVLARGEPACVQAYACVRVCIHMHAHVCVYACVCACGHVHVKKAPAYIAAPLHKTPLLLMSEVSLSGGLSSLLLLHPNLPLLPSQPAF